MNLSPPRLGRLLGAYLYESLILVAWSMLLTLVLLPAQPHVPASVWIPLLQTWLVLGWGVYFIGAWGRHGHTLAMKTWRLQLVNMVGGRPRWEQLVRRYVLALLGYGFFGATVWWRWFDRDGCLLHDRLAGTRLIVRPPANSSSARD